MRSIDKIIIHCSASPDNLDVGVREITQWHKARGWSDIGYHFVIRRGGILELGRNLKRAGAHCEGENKKSIGICLVGTKNFDPAQFEALKKLVKDLRVQFKNIPYYPHNFFPSAKKQGKTCPNFDIYKILDED